MKAAMERKIPQWGLLALGGLAAWWLFIRKPAAAAVARGWGQGPAQVGGTLSALSMGQARMGTHQVPKAPGAPVNIAFTFTGLTKNAAGAGIPWPYRVSIFLAKGPDLIGVPLISPVATQAFNVPVPITASLILPTTVVAGSLVSVLAKLEAAQSDPAGVPTATLINVFDKQHLQAIVVIGPAAPGGDISSIAVSQSDGIRWRS